MDDIVTQNVQDNEIFDSSHNGEVHQHVVTYICDKENHSFIDSEDTAFGDSLNIKFLTSEGMPKPNVALVVLPEDQASSKVTLELQEVSSIDKLSSKGAAETKQPYLLLTHTVLLKDYRLFHFVVSKKDVRALLVNITHVVDDVILKICATFGVCNPEEYFLWLPKGMEYTLQKKKKIVKQGLSIAKLRLGRREEPEKQAEFDNCLDGGKSIKDQYDFNIKPFILFVSKHAPDEEVDAGEQEDMGEEWPDFEDPNVAMQREFDQCWRGVVQGDYPVEREVAIQLAALLSQVYHGDLGDALENQPHEYSPGLFLPPAFAKSSAIVKESQEAHKKLAGKEKTEAVKDVIQLCRSRVTYEGLFFDVEVPVAKSTLKKVRQRTFGINHMGVINVDSQTGKVLFVHRFSDIHNGRSGEDILHLDFLHWDQEYFAYSTQSKIIMELLKVYIDMTKKGVIKQAPSKPLSY